MLIMNEDDKKAAKYRAEAKMGGTNAPAPADVMQEIADRKAAARLLKHQRLKLLWQKTLPKVEAFPAPVNVQMVAPSVVRLAE